MRPEVIAWWARARQGRGRDGGECRAAAGGGSCGPRGREQHSDHGRGHPGAGRRASPASDGGPFGVRRPLRFLSHKLELDEKQVAKLAKIIDELKTERAQAAVDERRSLAAFADAVSGEQFDAEKAQEAAERRIESSKRLQTQVLAALREMHGVLDDEQRETLGYLIRTGVLSL